MYKNIRRISASSPKFGEYNISSISYLWMVLLALTTGAFVACTPSKVSDAHKIKPEDLSRLYRIVKSPENLKTQLPELFHQSHKISRDDPNWPTYTYLVGEIKRIQHDSDGSRQAFREVAKWAQSDPYGDSWGGSGLAMVALWRWLQNLEQHEALDLDEVKLAIDVAENLSATRLYRGMVRPGLWPALPQLEEDVARRLARLAWNSHMEKEAQKLFVDYIAISSTGQLDPIEQRILNRLIESGEVSRKRLDLFRGIRLLSLVKTTEEKAGGIAILEKLWNDPNTDSEVRAKAGFHLAKEMKKNRDISLNILDQILEISKDIPLLQQALYLRGIVYNQAGEGRIIEAFRRDMNEIVQRYPGSPRTDDALFQLATDYHFEGELELALSYYEKLRSLETRHDWEDSAYFLPAMGLIGRGASNDLAKADDLLVNYLEKYPDGPFRLRSIFWRGRIAEKREQPKEASELFQSLIEERPYGYYAMRARLHLENGELAKNRLLLSPDSITRKNLQQLRSIQVQSDIKEETPYAIRVRDAVMSGLYSDVVKVQETLMERSDNVPLSQLDSEFLLTGIALLGSFRQDTWAAKDAAYTLDNLSTREEAIKAGISTRLRLAGAVGDKAKDWPLAIELMIVRNKEPRAAGTRLQNDSLYLSSAYPKVRKEEITDASWQINKTFATSRGLMYSIIRHESRFYAGAISKVGALGLCQLMDTAFADVNELNGGKLLNLSGKKTTKEYLLDPKLNIWTWAQYAQKRLGIDKREKIFGGLMSHQAGPTTYKKRWLPYWERLGITNDIEYKVETARFNATRNFARAVLADLMVVDAIGLWEQDVH